MGESIDQLMYKLPECIRKEIFYYIIPDIDSIQFRIKNDKYGYIKTAYSGDKFLESKCKTKCITIRENCIGY